MSVDPTPAITILSTVFVFHIVMVNIDIGLAIWIPLLKYIGEKRNNLKYIQTAKVYMRYFAILYASAGMFATAFTVFLLAFFPEFLWLAGQAMIIPFALVTLTIALRFICISAYWYGWDHFPRKIHNFIGLTLASTSFLIPFFFRSIFGFLNSPSGVLSLDPIIIDPIAVFLNPIFLPIYLKSMFGAIALTSFMLLFVHLYSYMKTKKTEIKDLLKLYLYTGSISLFVMTFVGVWYLFSIYIDVPYKFNNLFGIFVNETTTSDQSILFSIKLTLVTIQIIIILFLIYRSMNTGKFNWEDKTTQYSLLILGPCAIFTVAFGELTNLLSQLPYFVAVPELESSLPMINVNNSINDLAAVFDMYFITVLALTPIIIAIIYLLYWVFTINKQEINEFEEETK